MTETPYNSVNDKRLQALSLWLADNNFSYNKLTVVSADAGFRRYFRLHRDNSTLIAVDAPIEHEDTRAFLDIAARLADSGLRTPLVYCYSLEMGFLVIEDFGQTHIQQSLKQSASSNTLAADLYQAAINAIVQMQNNTISEHLPECDSKFLASELELFPRWYLETHLEKSITTHQQNVLNQTFDTLIRNATAQPVSFMHRDYHCRNLMVLEKNTIGIIDFQGAMKGPITYDVVSLLKDAYLDWPEGFQHALMEQHRLSLSPQVSWETYKRWFDLTGIQRQLKILGIFCRLYYRDNKASYLSHLNHVRSQVEATVAGYPELAPFGSLLADFPNTRDVA